MAMPVRTWMQWLLNPAAIAATGDAMAGKAVIVRIPATGRELDQNIWMVKQVLDVGAHGIIFPTVETPEQALIAIRAMRIEQGARLFTGGVTPALRREAGR